MKTKSYSIAKLKAGLSSVLREVAGGGEIIITDHNKAVARIVPINSLPPLPKVDLKALFEMPRIKLPRGSMSSAQLIRAIRDEE